MKAFLKDVRRLMGGILQHKRRLQNSSGMPCGQTKYVEKV
jgi:hypothetical protein